MRMIAWGMILVISAAYGLLRSRPASAGEDEREAPSFIIIDTDMD